MNATDSTPSKPRGGQLWLWFVLAAAAAAVYAYTLFMPPGGQGTEGPAIGRTLPYFQLDPLTGDSTGVPLEELQGRVAVVNFWGTWCPPCRLEFPHIVALAQKYADEPQFRLYAVSCGQGSDEDLGDLRSETMAFLAANGAAIPTYADQNASTRRAMTMALDLDGFAYPTTVVLDQRGKVRGLWIGYSRGTEREIESLVKQLLEPNKV